MFIRYFILLIKFKENIAFSGNWVSVKIALANFWGSKRFQDLSRHLQDTFTAYS